MWLRQGCGSFRGKKINGKVLLPVVSEDEDPFILDDLIFIG